MGSTEQTVPSRSSAQMRAAGSMAPAIPPGFQGKREQKETLEPFVPQQQATRRPSPSNEPVSLWSRLEPIAPAPKVESEVVEQAESAVAVSLIEQVLIESRSERSNPFAIQPRFSRVEEVKEVQEVAPVTPVAAAQKRERMSGYLSIWGAQPRPQRKAVVEQMMVEVALSNAEGRIVAPATEQSKSVVEEVKPAVDVQQSATPTHTLQPPAEAAEPVQPPMVAQEPLLEVASPLASRTSMLDAVHAVATQAAQQRSAAESDPVEPDGDVEPDADVDSAEIEQGAVDSSDNVEVVAEEKSHTDQVAEVIRMIEEEETVVAEATTPRAATEAEAKTDFSAEIQAAVAQEDEDEIDDRHFNEALDKISGTRAADSEAAQRREAIRHFTESAAKRRAERRNRVAKGAPAIVGGLPASTVPKEKQVEVETLGGGVLHLLLNGAKGVANIGRYTLLGMKYGLQDSKDALGKITSKS